MNFSSSASILICFLMVFSINNPTCNGAQRFCGRSLADVLDLICTNGFGRMVKKSIDPLDYSIDTDTDTSQPIEESSMFSKVPTSSLAKTRRRRHGVYDECCRKPCSMPELQSYCL